jgi:hypothetical protein
MFVFANSIVALDIVLNNTKKKKSTSTVTAQNWTPRRSRTQEVCDFLDTSSGQHVKMRYQSTINLTWNQLRINLAFCVQSFGL